MIELLWEQDPPGSSVNAIHKYIGSIRRLLEPDLEARASGRWLIRHGGGYRLAADENTSDLIAFRRMVKDARSARAEDRPADALDLLLEGLVLRRGACGEGLDLHGRNRDYFTAVDQEYVAAVAEAADMALATVQAPRILPILRQAALGEPLNESLQAHLILVLAATGQQALALSHYQVVRERLSDELGVDPGAEMCAAHSRVLRQEFSAAALGNLSNAAITGTAGRSPETADPPGGQAFLGNSSPCVAPLVPPAPLPPDLPTFAAREPELSRLSGFLTPRGESPGTVVVCAIDGTVGMGKATFAVHLAHHVAKHCEDGQLYRDLRGFNSSVSPAAPADALLALPGALAHGPRTPVTVRFCAQDESARSAGGTPGCGIADGAARRTPGTRTGSPPVPAGRGCRHPSCGALAEREASAARARPARTRNAGARVRTLRTGSRAPRPAPCHAAAARAAGCPMQSCIHGKTAASRSAPSR